jgi:hypothetical protein
MGHERADTTIIRLYERPLPPLVLGRAGGVAGHPGRAICGAGALRSSVLLLAAFTVFGFNDMTLQAQILLAMYKPFDILANSMAAMILMLAENVLHIAASVFFFGAMAYSKRRGPASAA